MKSLLVVLLCVGFAFSWSSNYLGTYVPTCRVSVDSCKWAGPLSATAYIHVFDSIALGYRKSKMVAQCWGDTFITEVFLMNTPPLNSPGSYFCFDSFSRNMNDWPDTSKIFGNRGPSSCPAPSGWSCTEVFKNGGQMRFDYCRQFVTIAGQRYLSIPIGKICWKTYIIYDQHQWYIEPGGGISNCGPNQRFLGVPLTVVVWLFPDTILIKAPPLTSVESSPTIIPHSIRYPVAGTYDVLGRRIHSMNPASAIYLEGKKRIVIH